MSKHTGPLARLLDTPHLARLVPQLPPETLHQLIRHGGLEACGELVASATPEQLTSVLDLDLWRHARPGRDDQFDADRFGEWIEVLVDNDETVAARIVAALEPHLVVAGLSRYIRVFDPGVFLPHETSDDEPGDGPIASSDGVECEVGGYLVRAIRADAWDAIVALLHALGTGHPHCFHEVMQGCRRLSNSAPEVDGLDNLLMEPEQWLHEVAADREQRRSQVGYSTAADARAFLAMARQRKRPERTNPIAAAYFRAADDVAAQSGHETSHLPQPALGPASTDGSILPDLESISALLAEAGVVPERPRALLEGATSEPSRLTRIRPLMAHVRDTNEEAYFARTREMAFLVNTLMAGCSVQSRPFTPQEASDAAVAICNLGLEQFGATLPDAFLVDHDLVTAFETGWAVLHEDVSLFVAERLIVTLTELRSADAEIQGGLHALRRELIAQRDAGTPWRARDALDALAILDMPAWASLLGLLDECPVLPAALTAILERHKGSISPTAFDFISTSGQLDQVRAFMGKLLHMLGP
jgi:hypothetical protein